ncbi:hypothetical protein A9Q99_17825 [Gammaproteobacteria bacterium 45_16_T64]|nr:hypothetical protein A9Q99_17825 [Gammaproteobacteria bacterium 45_16_T64]
MNQFHPQIEQSLSEFGSFTPEALIDLSALLQFRRFDENEYLLEKGQQATLIAFMLSGAMREFYCTEDGNEFNKAFVFTGFVTGSLYDLMSNKPSTATIQCLKASECLVCNYNDYITLSKKPPCLEKIHTQIITRLFCLKVERVHDLLTLDSYQRYQRLLEMYPQIEDEIQQYQIASFLGITSVSLSRFRRKNREQGKPSSPKERSFNKC